MVTLLLVLLLVVLVSCTIFKPVYGIMCYYIIRMVIPSTARVGSFSFNTVSLGVLLLFLLPHLVKTYRQSDEMAKKYIQAVSIIGGGLFALTFLGAIPLSFQWSSLIQMLLTEIMPSVLLMFYLKRRKDFKTFCNVVCIMAMFTALYGIYTYVTVDNPIYTMLNNSGEEGYVLEDYATGRLGLEGIAVGIYNDKIALSLISLLLFTFLINKNCVNKILLTCALVLTFVDMFLTTQRTALFCVIAFFVIMYFDQRNKLVRKYFKWGVLLLVVMALFSNSSMIRDSFYSLVYIFDDQAQQQLGIGGSSTDMRMLQFANGFDYLGLGRVLQGEGYNFPSYYYQYIFRSALFGLDPRFLGFESFLLQTLMGSGLIGITVWFVGLFKIYKALCPEKNIYDIAFFASYFLAIVMTDTSASFYLFFFLVVLNSKQYLLYQKTPAKYVIVNHHPNLQRRKICPCNS